MGVIGRLDDQVNEKIIKPVGAKHRPEGEETPPPAPESRRQPRITSPEEGREDEDNSQAPPQPELPVWLL